MKAATSSTAFHRHAQVISIHAAREGGDESVGGLEDYAFISIHAAREGGDGVAVNPSSRRGVFQSTPPVKAATFAHIHRSRRHGISIHAAREGGDMMLIFASNWIEHFNPRRP